MNFGNINKQFRNCKLKIYIANLDFWSPKVNLEVCSKTWQSADCYHFLWVVFKATLTGKNISISIQ